MGPDEIPSREEVGLLARFMFAKFEQQGEIITALAKLLISRGVISDPELVEMVEELKKSEKAVRARKTLEALREFATIHTVSRQYLDRLEE